MTPQKVSKIVSKHLITVSPQSSLLDAYQLLTKNGIRHLPVVTEQGNLVGIISDLDFLSASVPESHRSNESQNTPSFTVGSTVADFMTTNMNFISIDGDVKEVVNSMIDMKISSCLVEKEGTIVGIVTTEDLLVLLKSFLENPVDSLKAKLENFILLSPLGAMAHQLSNAGI